MLPFQQRGNHRPLRDNEIELWRSWGCQQFNRTTGMLTPQRVGGSGREYDKEHFIAHSLDGAVDRLELNVFIQRRDLNRGWSVQGKLYRAMEKYCVLKPGTFCFSRPLYEDQTSRPAFLEFGVLKETGELWVARFDNRQ